MDSIEYTYFIKVRMLAQRFRYERPKHRMGFTTLSKQSDDIRTQDFSKRVVVESFVVIRVRGVVSAAKVSDQVLHRGNQGSIRDQCGQKANKASCQKSMPR